MGSGLGSGAGFGMVPGMGMNPGGATQQTTNIVLSRLMLLLGAWRVNCPARDECGEGNFTEVVMDLDSVRRIVDPEEEAPAPQPAPPAEPALPCPGVIRSVHGLSRFDP